MLYLSILFGIIPAIHFALLYYYSLKRGTLEYLYSIPALTILDWLFVPFNALLPFAITFSWKMFALFFALGILPILYIHSRWKIYRTHGEVGYMITKEGFTPEGWVHFVFMLVQVALIVTLLLATPISRWYLACLGCLLAYLLAYLLYIYKKRMTKPAVMVDLPFIGLSTVLVIGRLLWVIQ